MDFLGCEAGHIPPLSPCIGELRRAGLRTGPDGQCGSWGSEAEALMSGPSPVLPAKQVLMSASQSDLTPVWISVAGSLRPPPLHGGSALGVLGRRGGSLSLL